MRSHVTSPTGDFGAQEAAMQSYLREGEKRAYSLGNRGPLKFNADGKLDKDILRVLRIIKFRVFNRKKVNYIVKFFIFRTIFTSRNSMLTLSFISVIIPLCISKERN